MTKITLEIELDEEKMAETYVSVGEAKAKIMYLEEAWWFVEDVKEKNAEVKE